MDDIEARRTRAAQRAERMVLNKARLTEGEHDLDPIEGGAAIMLVTQLSRESWSLAGFDVPRYARRDTPIRFIPRSPT